MKPTGKRLKSVLLGVLTGCTFLTGCSDMAVSPDPAPPKVTVSAVTDSETSTETVPVTTETATEAHVSPTEMIVSELGAQMDVDVSLFRDGDDAGKVFKAPLEKLMLPGDTVHSFTFVFYGPDDRDIGEFKGGCGISVTADCPSGDDANWYQTADFTRQAQGSYLEVTWDVPADVQPYIDPTGVVQIGYWWGNTESVTLREVICNYTRSAVRPVDSTQTVSVRKTLNYSNEATKSVRVPLGDVLGEEGVPQAITFDISAGKGFRKFTGAFGITSGEDMYMTDTVAVQTADSSLSLTWLIPEEVAYNVPQDAEAMLGYWWSEAGDMTVNSLTVKYSIGGTPPEPPQETTSAAAQETPAEVQEVTNSMTADGNAAALAANLRIGWNLGNTLDSYDKSAGKKVDETYWGNPIVTKELFDAVRAKGFNAVRIPVSWTNHLKDDNTIDPVWLNRVQNVVDSAMADDLYVILNMHHDDYTWLEPLHAQEDAVTEKYVTIWKQIAEHFREYDTRLLFEGMNEPRVIGSANEWTGGTAEERDVINHLLAEFVKTVRESGGQNTLRTLVVTTHAASITDAAVNGLLLPKDDNLIVSIHNYSPWKFTTKDYPAEKIFDDSGRAELDRQFSMLHDKFISKGVPVIIGEFGAENKNNDSDRRAFYSYYVETAARYGIPCFIWDNGLKDSYGLIDRRTYNWFDGGIADAAVGAVKK
ncbi:MAG: cellulase family glycosylhydrolase [Oscillospiraceae bacterium]|nr:cellulase family glycosylhydrolase [Oscillospiraceae bacterium]